MGLGKRKINRIYNQNFSEFKFIMNLFVKYYYLHNEDKMKYKGCWSRWHRFDANGKKEIRKFGTNEIPNPLVEHGYTNWIRGTGPLSEQHYNAVTTAVRAYCVGRPKSTETKQKMSLAKKGVPKTPEHRENMRKAWQRKRELLPNKYKQIFNTFNE